MNQNKENALYNKIIIKKNVSQIQSKIRDLLKDNYYINERNGQNKTIKFSKTEIDLAQNFPNFSEINFTNNSSHNKNKNNNINVFNHYKLNSARSFKLNYTDLNKYMKQVHHINSTRVNDNKTNKISLNKYFNLSKINNDYKIINKNSLKTLYNSVLTEFNKNKRTKYNSLLIKNEKTFINDINNFYFHHETENKKNKNIKKNNNKLKKENELIKLKKLSNELKAKNFKLHNEISLLKEKNYILEYNKNVKNKKVFINIKNILQKNIFNSQNTNCENILNNFNTKIYKSSSYKGKINSISQLYNEEKLKNSFIDKINLLYLNNNSLLNGTVKDLDIEDKKIENIWKWINFLIDNIEEQKNKNYNIQKNIDKTIEENNMCKNYYYKWINIFNIKEKEELIKKIDDLINDKNINANEEAKMYKMLLNKND